MGLDALHLRVLMTSSDNEHERKHARKVLKLLNRGRHWVLVVLLLGNVVRPKKTARLVGPVGASHPVPSRPVRPLPVHPAANGPSPDAPLLSPFETKIVNESLPIFLDSVLGGGAEAVVASTLLIVVFGEIIPQSLGVRYGLAIGAYSSPFVLTMMYLFAVRSPLSLSVFLSCVQPPRRSRY